MLEIRGNIWDYHQKGEWVVITTNGSIKQNGQAVMGAGVAKQAARRFPSLPNRLGFAIRFFGNNVVMFTDLKIATLPVKVNWMNSANINLIVDSIQELVRRVTDLEIEKIYMVRPGCGNGQLDWETQVKPEIKPFLDNRFIIVEVGEL